jgi:hypothetical protein
MDVLPRDGCMPGHVIRTWWKCARKRQLWDCKAENVLEQMTPSYNIIFVWSYLY